jgi:hypothetical protein
MFSEDNCIVSVDGAEYSIGSRDASFAVSFSFRLTEDATKEECVDLMNALFESMVKRVAASYDRVHPRSPFFEP